MEKTLLRSVLLERGNEEQLPINLSMAPGNVGPSLQIYQCFISLWGL